MKFRKRVYQYAFLTNRDYLHKMYRNISCHVILSPNKIDVI